jgi:glycosyltransferase involved in cell wall biosynthesis
VSALAGEDDSASPPAILAVIPAHDEAGRVGGVIAGVRAAGLPLLVVDDGSTDDTAGAARAAGAEVLRLAPNRGKGGALKAGFAEALARGHEAVLTLDADGQHDAGEIPAFLRTWQRERPDLVVGRRDFHRMPPFRRLTNSLARFAFSRAVGHPVPDNQSGYRLLSRRLVEAVLASPEEGFAFEVEVLALCLGRGFPVAWVPISTVYGDEESDIRPLEHLVSFVRVTRRARRAMRRARDGLS